MKSMDHSEKRDKNYVWSLIDEIVNSKKIYNINLHNSVSTLFYTNPDLIFLYDNNETPYEVPSVVYTGDQYNISAFNSVFGKRKQETSITSLGKLYIFHSYETAKDKAYKRGNETEENRSAVVRYAVFSGKTKVFKKEDLPELLSEKKENNWSQEYHSAYVGKLTLQNGEQLADTPMLITTKYDQQIPLTMIEI